MNTDIAPIPTHMRIASFRHAQSVEQWQGTALRVTSNGVEIVGVAMSFGLREISAANDHQLQQGA